MHSGFNFGALRPSVRAGAGRLVALLGVVVTVLALSGPVASAHQNPSYGNVPGYGSEPERAGDQGAGSGPEVTGDQGAGSGPEVAGTGKPPHDDRPESAASGKQPSGHQNDGPESGGKPPSDAHEHECHGNGQKACAGTSTGAESGVTPPASSCAANMSVGSTKLGIGCTQSTPRNLPQPEQPAAVPPAPPVPAPPPAPTPRAAPSPVAAGGGTQPSLAGTPSTADASPPQAAPAPIERQAGPQEAPGVPTARGIIVAAARSFTPLFLLMGAVVVFLALQGRLDRREPKLVAAPLDARGDHLYFS